MTDIPSITYTPQMRINAGNDLSENAYEAATAPRNREPVSPIKILAGFILKIKNPRTIPMVIEDIVNASSDLVRDRKKVTTEMANIVDDASPSTPSVKLAQLIIPSKNIIASG